MITIALDEKGSFESIKPSWVSFENNFIAGLIYDDNGSARDTKNEIKRTKAYLRKVCSIEGARFPEDLHINHAGDNKSIVKRVEKRFNATIGDYIKSGVYKDSNGNYDGHLCNEPRKGKYRFFLKIRSNEGREDLLNAGVGKIMMDSAGANTYIHMAEESITSLVFRNIFIEKDCKFSFKLATRMTVIRDIHSSAEKKLDESMQSLGYLPKRFTDGSKNYQNTNADVYRLALERGMVDFDRKDLKVVDFSVDSIRYEWSYNQKQDIKENYKEKNGHYPNETEFSHAMEKEYNNMIMRYMADCICSFIGSKIKKNNTSDVTPEKAIEIVDQEFRKISGHEENYCFAYDSTDVFYNRAYDCWAKGDLIGALYALYDGKKLKTSMIHYYRKNLYPIIEEKIAEDMNREAFCSAAGTIQRETYRNNISQEKLKYCYSILEKVAAKHAGDVSISDSLYSFYDAGVSINNHIGAYNKATECFNRLLTVSRNIGIDQYLRARNKQVVSLCDMQEFDKALDLAEKNISIQEQVQKAREALFPEESFAYAKARALSQCAQVLAFMKNERAEELFLEALSMLKDDHPDYFITLSYLLHYYLDNGLRVKYEEWSSVYFGGNRGLIDQFGFLVKNTTGKDSLISFKFGMFVYMKACWAFYKGTIPNCVKNALADLEGYLEDANKDALKEINGHPWEITFKYMALLSFKLGDQQTAEKYINRSARIISAKSDIIFKIVKAGENEYKAVKSGKEDDNPFTYMYR